MMSPAWAQLSVIGELSQDRDARPGEKYEGLIIVKNDTDEPQEAKVYQTDYLFYFNGTNDYGEPGTMPRSNARWVTFSPASLIVPPQSSVSVNYTVTVPADIKGEPVAGSYWSMLMVEGIGKGSAESTLPPDPGKTQMGIQQTIRYGIQLATHIAQTGVKKISFLNAQLVTKDDGGMFLQVDIENTGNLGIRPEVYVELFNAGGTSVGKYEGNRFRMYPGTSVRQMINLSKAPRGEFRALVVVDTGGDDVFGAQYTIKL
jgi:hypothetical protein